MPTPDYGIDLALHDVIVDGRRRVDSGYRIDIQAKSSTLARVEAGFVRYDLDVPDYDSLRALGVGCPRILVVLVLPPDETRWVTQSEEELLLRRGAYWLSLRGRRGTTNRRSVRLRIPRANLFTVESVQSLVARIKAGGEP